MQQFNTLEDLARYLKGSAWERGSLKRIYFDGYGKDIKAFLQFDDDNYLIDESGHICASKLCVFSSCAQSRSWLINRCKQVKFQIMQHISTITHCEICSDWQEVIL